MILCVCLGWVSFKIMKVQLQGKPGLEQIAIPAYIKDRKCVKYIYNTNNESVFKPIFKNSQFFLSEIFWNNNPINLLERRRYGFI